MGKKRTKGKSVNYDELKQKRTISVTPTAWRRLKALAVGQGISVSEQIEIIARSLMIGLEKELQGFSGTSEYHTHVNIFLTDGAKFLAEKAECYWLFNIIASYQPRIVRILEEKDLRNFQIWTLAKKENDGAIVKCEWDTDQLIVQQAIEYADFPLQSIKIYVVDSVAMLPGEY